MLIPILVCEIAFWVVIVLGLTARYVLRLRRLGAALLVGVPVVDLVLLVFIVIDLRGGATAHFTHGLGAVYLAVSIVYGHRLVAWADRWFAHRFDGASRPAKVRRYGMVRAGHEWKEFGILLLALVLSAAVLLGCIALAGDSSRTGELEAWFGRLGLVALVAAIWPVGYTLFPAKAPVVLPQS